MTVSENVSEKLVGPVIRGWDPEIVEAVIAAIETDNPDADVTVEDQGGYVRISVPHRCVLTRRSLEDELDREFPLGDLEPALSGFAGRIKQSDDQFVWYLERQD